MTNSTNFSLDDLTLAYSEEDYKPQRKEPVAGLWFEFKVVDATVEQSKHGYLQVKLVTEALDKDGAAMFKKWVNVPVPVSIGQNVAPAWSKGLWLANVRPLFPEDAHYDRSERDEVTGQKIYFKGDQQIKSGREFEEAQTAANRKIGQRATDVAKAWVKEGDGAVLADFSGHTVFGRTVSSKDGQYINIERMTANLPSDAECVYDSKEAFGR